MFRRVLFVTFVPLVFLAGGTVAHAETCGLLAQCPPPPAPPAPPPAPEPQPPQPPAPAPAPNPEQRLLELMNRERAEVGAPALVWRDDVAAFAEDHSGRMAREGRIWHNDEYFSAESRRRFDAKTVGENVALNKSIDDAHRRLMNSPGHRANIVNPKFTEAGVGVVKDGNGDHFITEAFVEPDGSRPAPAATKTSTPPKAGGTTAAPAAPPKAPAAARASAPAGPVPTTPATTAAATAEEASVEQPSAEVGLEPQVLSRTSSGDERAPKAAAAAHAVSSHGSVVATVAAIVLLVAALAALVTSARSRRVSAPAFAASTRAA